MLWYQGRPRNAGNKAARERIGLLNKTPLPAVAEERVEGTPEIWTKRVKTEALGREAQASSAGSTLRSMKSFLATTRPLRRSRTNEQSSQVTRSSVRLMTSL